MRTEGTHTKTGTRSHRQDHTLPGKKKDLAVRGEQKRHKQKHTAGCKHFKKFKYRCGDIKGKEEKLSVLRLYSTGEVQVSLSKKKHFQSHSREDLKKQG